MAVARSSSGGVHAMYFRFFIDDVIFSHKPTLLDVAAQLKRSAHAALGLAINCAQFVVFCLFFSLYYLVMNQLQDNGRTGLLFGRFK